MWKFDEHLQDYIDSFRVVVPEIVAVQRKGTRSGCDHQAAGAICNCCPRNGVFQRGRDADVLKVLQTWVLSFSAKELSLSYHNRDL